MQCHHPEGIPTTFDADNTEAKETKPKIIGRKNHSCVSNIVSTQILNVEISEVQATDATVTNNINKAKTPIIVRKTLLQANKMQFRSEPQDENMRVSVESHDWVH
jgi:hypothetical protein